MQGFYYLPDGILQIVSWYFTPKGANDSLILLRPLMEEAMNIGEKIRAHQPELWAAVQKSAGNGGNPRLSKLLKDFDRLDILLHRLKDMGVIVKDLQAGLIDFPAWHDQREVYLCWKYGEERVGFWHEVDDGYSGRQLIDWE